MYRRLTAAAGTAILTLTALAPTTAHARETEACYISQGSVTADGGHRFQRPTANTYPGMGPGWLTTGVFPRPQEVRLSARQTIEPNISGTDRYGYVVINDGLYWMNYWAPDGNASVDPDRPPTLRRIGGGWAYFNVLETSFYESPDGAGPKVYRSAAYGLKNGVLYRWRIDNGTWRATGSYPGFSAVKSIALIAKTATYDTFIANTRGGALYTIRIPTTSPMKPIVKPVRTRTWQGFETLIAERCGQYGTLLLGIDKDTGTGHAYAVGHANGTATVINGLGKVNGTFPDPHHFRLSVVSFYDWLNGE